MAVLPAAMNSCALLLLLDFSAGFNICNVECECECVSLSVRVTVTVL